MARALVWLLRVLALGQVILAGLWVFGSWGAGLVDDTFLPFSTDHGFYRDYVAGPVVAADLTDPVITEKFGALATDLGGPSLQIADGAHGDITPGWSVQFATLTWWQSTAWVTLHAVPLVVVAVLWWALARVITQGGGDSVFTIGNARRLTVSGCVVLVGAPILSLLTWRFHVWVAESSQLAERIRVPSYGMDQLPWVAMAAGFALIVLGQIWRHGVVMEKDLGGLV